MKLFATCLFSLVSLTAIAQQNIQFGIKAGINNANVTSLSNKDGGKVGFNAAVFTHIPLCNRMSVQPEIGYSVQGAESMYVKDRLDYITVPLVFQYAVTRNIRVESGPQLGILAFHERRVHPAVLVMEQDFKNVDASWVAGAGYFVRNNIGINLRYNHGLTDISRNTTTLKNRVWQLSLNYLFGKR